MASNQLPINREQLFVQGDGMARGLHELEARLGVKQNTEASLRADLSAAVLAHRDYNAAVSKNTEFVEALAAADSNAKEFITTAKGVVGLFLGNQWSPAWIAVGFSRHSLSVPSSVDRRKALLGTMQTYFQSHPEQQMASFNVTDARAGELCTALQNAAFAVSTSNSAAGAAKTVRDRTELELRWRMSGLIGELGQLLDDDDSAWWTFGLNRPSDPATPNIPDNLVLTAGLPGSINVTWEPARRAERYRVYKKEDGEAEFQPADTTSEFQTIVSGLKAGGTVHIQVSAANNAGESLPTAPAEIVVPAGHASAAQA